MIKPVNEKFRWTLFAALMCIAFPLRGDTRQEYEPQANEQIGPEHKEQEKINNASNNAEKQIDALPQINASNHYNNQSKANPQANPQARTYSKKGADTCLKCHDEDSSTPVLAIFKTAHGNPATHNGPFSTAALQCEACHGPAGKHPKKRLRKGEQRQPMISFTKQDWITVEQKNKICVDCHQRNSLSHWQGSRHQVANTACVDCHTIHAASDPIQVKVLQVELCTQCHRTQKLTLHRASTHPLRDGQMGCTDCHQLHNSDSENLLIGDNVNDTCFGCHAEKRGPYLWEHEPVSDNCSNCHKPHGSNHSSMLIQRPPFLCQNCHSSIGHASITPSSNSLLNGSPSTLLVGRSCTNCHAQVHGSNHPSGSRLQL